MKAAANRPQGRHAHHLNQFAKFLTQSMKDYHQDPRTFIGQALHARKGRDPAFALEGLARIEARIGRNPREAKKWLKHYKGLEDVIGAFDHWNGLARNQNGWKLAPVIQDDLVRRTHHAAGRVEEKLLQLGWLERGEAHSKLSLEPLKELRQSLEDASWHKPSKERRLLARLLRDHAIQTHKAFVNGTLPFDELEHGLHEFRRKLRWLGIYSQCNLGKVQLTSGKPGEPLAHWVSPERAQNRYNQLIASPAIEQPVFFLRGGYYALTEFISELGRIKDAGLATWEITRIARMHGIKETAVPDMLGKDYVTQRIAVRDSTKVMRRFLIGESLLRHLADHFEQQT